MHTKTEEKIRFIHKSWENGQKKQGAKKVRQLTKKEIFFVSSSHLMCALPEMNLKGREYRISFENYIGNCLDGMYQ